MKIQTSWVVSVLLLVGLIGAVFYFQGVIQDKDAQIQSLTQKYNSLVANSNEKIAAANARLHALADEANSKLAVANLPQVSIAVSFRKALLSSGNVAVIRNIAAQSIPASLAVNRPSTGQQKLFELVFDAGQVKEIGEREGWAFLPGDTILISQPEHKSLTVTLTVTGAPAAL